MFAFNNLKTINSRRQLSHLLRNKMGGRKKFYFLFILLLFGSACTSNHWADRLDWKELSLSDLPDSSDYPTAHAVVLLDEGQVSIEGQGEIKLTRFDRHRVIRVLDRGGLSYCNVVIPYFPGNSSVEQIKARTIHGDGRISALNPDQIFDIFLYPDFIFYADQKAKKFTFPDVEPGDILEYRYQILYQNLTLYHSWNFQDFIPVLRSRFEIHFPSSWKLRHKVYHYQLEPDSVKRPSGFKTIYRWQVKDMPALIKEPAMPPLADVAAYLLFAPLGFESWKDVANWYFELSKDRLKADRSIKDFVRRLLANASDERQQLQIIYEWVRDHIRYIAIAIGIGSYQPHFAKQVFLNRYGDCKDMVTLLCAMAQAAGLQVYPMLVSTRQNGQLDTSLATPFRFNHVIAFAQLKDGQTFYLDPTHKGAPFGFLPWYLRDVYGLIVRKHDDYRLQKISDIETSNQTRVRGQITFRKDGSAVSTLQFAFYGSPAARLRAALLPANVTDRKRWLETFLCQMDWPFQIQTFQFQGLSTFSDTLRFNVQLEMGQEQEAQQPLSFVPGQLIDPELWQLFRAATRVHAIQFGFPFSKSLELRMTFPQTWNMRIRPLAQQATSAFGRFSLTCTTEQSNALKLIYGFQLSDQEIPAEQYSAFQSFLDRAHRCFAQPLVFSQKGQPIRF